MEADLDRSSINPNRLTPLNPGQFYTLLSRGKESGGTKLSNFHEDNIKVNKKALMEIERLRTESLLNPMHPLSTFVSESVISLLNMRSWNLHLSHFLSDPAHINLCDIFCFTETQLQQDPLYDVNNFSDSWNSIFKHTDHGLALCYNSEHIDYVDQFEMTNEIEIMACLLRCDSLILSDFILVIVYRKPGSIGNFFSRLIEELRKLPTGYRTIVVGDFNLDQRLRENSDIIEMFASTTLLHQRRSNFSTHIEGGILDLVFDNSNTNDVQWQPTPFSDHFILYFPL